MKTSGSPTWPFSRSRAAVTAWLKGLIEATVCSQSGASDIGSRMPESSSTGTTIEFMSGASASSVRSHNATAYENGLTTSTISASRPRIARTPGRSTVRPNGIATAIMTTAWASRITTSRSDRPRSIATRLIGVTRIRSTTPARNSAISPKPAKRLNMASWMSRPGHEHVVGAALRKPGRGSDRLQQRAEEHEIENRLHQPDEHPGRGLQREVHRALEHEPGVANGLHRWVSCPRSAGGERVGRRPLRRAANGRSGGGRRRRGWAG